MNKGSTAETIDYGVSVGTSDIDATTINTTETTNGSELLVQVESEPFVSKVEDPYEIIAELHKQTTTRNIGSVVLYEGSLRSQANTDNRSDSGAIGELVVEKKKGDKVERTVEYSDYSRMDSLERPRLASKVELLEQTAESLGLEIDLNVESDAEIHSALDELSTIEGVDFINDERLSDLWSDQWFRSTVLDWHITKFRKFEKENLDNPPDKKFLNKLFEELGFSEDEGLDFKIAWMHLGSLKKSESKEQARNYQFRRFTSNMLSMFGLEAIEPGACRKIYDKFGIRHFLRYSHRELLTQLNEQEEHKKPTVVLSATDDWNGALSDVRHIKQAYDGEDIIYVEANDLREVAERLLDLSKVKSESSSKGYKKRPIKRLVVSAHGSNEGITLGRGRGSRIGRRTVRLSKSMKRLKKSGIFTRRPEIVLWSCETAKEGEDSFAGELAEKTDIKVQATDIKPNKIGRVKRFTQRVIYEADPRKIKDGKIKPGDGEIKSIVF